MISVLVKSVDWRLTLNVISPVGVLAIVLAVLPRTSTTQCVQNPVEKRTAEVTGQQLGQHCNTLSC